MHSAFCSLCVLNAEAPVCRKSKTDSYAINRTKVRVSADEEGELRSKSSEQRMSRASLRSRYEFVRAL